MLRSLRGNASYGVGSAPFSAGWAGSELGSEYGGRAFLAVWGKIFGSLAGFAMGGPFGAVMGAALGHAADTQGPGMLQGRLPGSGGAAPALGAADLAALLGNREAVFSIGVVVLAAKLAKADGPVKREEIDAFKTLFRIPQQSLRDVGRLFDQARDSSEGWEPFADRMSEAFADNRGMLEDVLGALFVVARADGPVNKAEHEILRSMHARLGLNQAAWDRARGGGGAPSQANQGPDPYLVLGVARDAPAEQVRAAWKNLMRENHPDTLAARGVPADFVKRATDKVAQINAAWDRIKRERGI